MENIDESITLLTMHDVTIINALNIINKYISVIVWIDVHVNTFI